MAAGDVAIKVSMNTSHAEKDLAELKAKIERFERNIKSDTDTKTGLEEKALQMGGILDAAKAKLYEMQTAAKGVYSTQDISEQKEYVKGLQKEWDSTMSSVERYDRNIASANTQLEGMKIQAGQMEAEIDKANSPMVRLKSAMEAGVKTAGTLLNRIKSLAVSMASFIGKGILSVSHGVISTVKNLNVFSKISGKLGPSLSKLGTMVKQAFVFGVVTKGLNYVREQMGGLISKNTEFMAALSRLKGVLLTAFQPIYDYIMPALTALVNGLTRAMAVAAQFIAALFGKTAQQAQSNAKALNDESKSLSGTGEAAEEAAGSLAGFDEINTIQTEDKSGGGGGGGAGEAGADFGYMFEDGQMPFDSWGAAFDAFLGKILDGIPRLRSAFDTFANNLNGYTKKVLDMFTFPGVKEKVMALGQEIGSALNELVQNINWYQLGQALGAGLNLALLFLVNFIYTFDWLSLGASLAEALNGLVSEIDWSAFGQLLWSGFKIGIETLAGFILGLDMPQLAKAASDIVIGFFNSMTDTLANIDWFQIGQQVKDFLVNVDWGGVATSVFTAIGAAFGAAAEFLWGLIKDAWDSVVNWWHENAYEDGKFTLQGLLDGIVNVVKNIGSWIKEHIFQPFIDGFKKVFGIHSPSTVMSEQGKLLMDGLKQGITNKIAAVIATFKGLWEKIKGVFSNVTEWFRSKFSAAWQAVKNVFSTGGKIFDGIKDGILDGLKAVINAIIGGINKVISVPFNGLNSALRKIKNVDILGLRPFSWINTISVPQIPKLAQGAVIPPNREFAAILGDQKRGYNIEAPEDLIRKIVREEAGGNAEMIALLRQILSATRARQKLYVKERVLAETARDGINDMTRQAGKPVLLF